MDMMFNLVANDPDVFGLYGIMEYSIGAADKEVLLWASRLMRHYCIEGNTSMLSDTPYVLTHIENPDFDDDSKAWTLSPAEEARHTEGGQGSMAVKYLDGYGMFQGRHTFYKIPPDNGNHFLWTKRSERKPNVFSQEIRNLQPGKLYSVKVISGDYSDLVKGEDAKKTLALSVKIEGAEVIADKSFQEEWRKPNTMGARGGTYSYWMNLHRIVFRATSGRAELVISDWLAENAPGGPIGQEIICNFIDVQPYLE